MSIEAKLVLVGIFTLITFLPFWSKLLPYNICIGYNSDLGWTCRIERKEANDGNRK